MLLIGPVKPHRSIWCLWLNLWWRWVGCQTVRLCEMFRAVRAFHWRWRSLGNNTESLSSILITSIILLWSAQPGWRSQTGWRGQGRRVDIGLCTVVLLLRPPLSLRGIHTNMVLPNLSSEGDCKCDSGVSGEISMQGAAAVRPSARVMSSACNNLHRTKLRGSRTPRDSERCLGEPVGFMRPLSHSESMSTENIDTNSLQPC